MTGRSLIVGVALAGHRLDKVLGALLPELGLRARRRLWNPESGGQVRVNGKPRPPGYAVVEGDNITLSPPCAETVQMGENPEASAPCALPGNDVPRFLEARDGLLFFYKPAGMHSVSLPGGRGGPALEEHLAALLPEDMTAARAPTGDVPPVPTLLNRLDYGTSGLLVAVMEGTAALRWYAAEEAGQCRKTYVALLTGTLTTAMTVTRALDTRHRRVTRVLPEEAPLVRHTVITPVATVRAEEVAGLTPWAPSLALCSPEQPLTWALCHIRKGARHQIRAHAAHAGFPLWGDARYDGRGLEGKCACFILHNSLLEVGTAAVTAPCPWQAELTEKIANNITLSLKANNFLS